jgi:sec-independent protein translocase protein TatA
MTTLALLPNLFGSDGLIIFLILLLLFGAKRLPELAKGLGSAVREFSKAKDEIEHEITRPAQPRIESPKETEARRPVGTEAHQEPQERSESQDSSHHAA